MNKLIYFNSLCFVLLFGCGSTNREKQEIEEPSYESVISSDNIPQQPEPEMKNAKIDIVKEDTSSNNSKYKTAKDFMNRCEGWLNDPDRTGTNIRKTPNGKVAYTIKNKYEGHEPDYRLFDIIKSEGNWMYIEASQWEEDKFKGYIHNSLVESSLRGGKLELLDAENGHLTDSLEFDPFGFQKVNILSYKNTGWAKIKFTFNEELYEGWVRTFKLCGTPYTTCG